MRHALGVILLLIVGAANAALVDNGSYTTDTATQLDWLDLSETVGLSYTDALVANTAWRLATNTEVESLFGTAFDGYYNTDSSGQSGINDGAYADQIEDTLSWRALLGLTGVSEYSYGLYQDEGSVWRMLGTFYRSDTQATVLGLDYVADMNVAATNGSDYHGIFVVRSSVVPIPAAVWLFGSGLGLLGWFRRRAS